LLEHLPPEVDIALILNPRLSVVEFLAAACDELHVAYPVAAGPSVKVLVDALHGYLLRAHAQGRRTVLIIDEAQNLDAEVLEQIRLLTNLETPAEKLLQIILIGQPELMRLLERQELRQLAQRITARYHLLPFSARDVYAYVRHRLKVAGGNEALFTPAALWWVRWSSGGVPRVINVVCDRALLGAYAHDRRRVGATTVRRAAREVWKPAAAGRLARRLGWWVGLGALGCAGLGVAVLDVPSRVPWPWRAGAPPPLEVAAAPAPGPSAPGDGLAVRDVAGAVSPGAAEVATAKASIPPTSAGPRLADLLADPAGRGDDHAAFASLYARWNLEYRKPSSGLGCDAGRAAGLECLFRVGTWNKLRRYDLPAILELTGPTGERHRAALVGLTEESATLVIGKREYSFPLTEIDRVWDGAFILIWKTPPLGSRMVARGMRGPEVEWLRRQLDALDGRTAKERPSDLYDAELERRVMAFQRSRSLVPDGRVGGETLTHLVLASRGTDIPTLSSATP
jgi:general secretion pathway protein A